MNLSAYLQVLQYGNSQQAIFNMQCFYFKTHSFGTRLRVVRASQQRQIIINTNQWRHCCKPATSNARQCVHRQSCLTCWLVVIIVLFLYCLLTPVPSFWRFVVSSWRQCQCFSLDCFAGVRCCGRYMDEDKILTWSQLQVSMI